MIEVELIGQIGFKKLREKDSGAGTPVKKYLHLSIADDKYSNQQRHVTWYTVFVNGDRAEKFNFLEVGDLVLVKGDIQLSAKISQHTNEPMAYLAIDANKIVRLRKRYNNNEKSKSFEEGNDDDIPF